MKTVLYVGWWSDEAKAVRSLVHDLRAMGVRAKTGYSVYCGHKTLLVALPDVKRAKALLREIDPDNGAYIASDCLDP